MMNKTLGIIAVFLMFAGSSACKKEDTTPVKKELPPRTLQELINRYHAKHPELPGITATIITQNLQISTAAAGYADVLNKTPLTSQHKIGVASNTKMLTSVIILQLMEEGKLKLSDKISVHLSNSWVDSLNIQNGILMGSAIRIIDLLKHTSGIYDYVDANFITSTTFFPNRQYAIDDLIRYSIYSGASEFAPGAPGMYSYSSTNYILLGLIIEKITSKSYLQVLHERILSPAQMNNSYLLSYEPEKPSLAHGYNGFYDIYNDNLSWVWATGGLASHAFDMARFMSNLMNGMFFRNPSTLQLMLTFTSESVAEYDYQYGLGILKFKFGNGFNPIGHMGSLHGYTSACLYLPEQNSYMFVGITTGGAHAFLFDILGQMYQLQTVQSLPKPKIPRLGGKLHHMFR